MIGDRPAITAEEAQALASLVSSDSYKILGKVIGYVREWAVRQCCESQGDHRYFQGALMGIEQLQQTINRCANPTALTESTEGEIVPSWRHAPGIRSGVGGFDY